MGRAPVSPPSGRWRTTSAIRLVSAALLLSCALGSARGENRESVLLYPLRSHWLSEPLAESVTNGISQALTDAGFGVVLASRTSPAVRRAVADGWLEARDLEGRALEGARDTLAVAAGATASLTGELTETEDEISVRLALRGAVSRWEARFGVSAPAAGGAEAAAPSLGRQVASALAEGAWAEAGADERGRRAAAVERYAAGRSALAAGMYRDAVLELEAALAGEWDNPDYLRWAAEARAAEGDYKSALVRLRYLAALEPENAEALLRSGDVALLAGEPEQAEAAFMGAGEIAPDDARAVEGVARSARARGDFERSERHYDRLLALLGLAAVGEGYVGPSSGEIGREPGMIGAPTSHRSLAAILARRADDTVRLTDIPAEEVELQLARVYLRAGDMRAGVNALVRYHAGESRPCKDDEYLDVFPALDEQAEGIGRAAQMTLAARALGELDDEEADSEMDRMHDESDRLATLAERMAVSRQLDPAHRYRVLAYNLLNESNFESLMFLRTGDPDRHRRAELLRTAARKARAQANLLGEALLGREGSGATSAQPGPG